MRPTWIRLMLCLGSALLLGADAPKADPGILPVDAQGRPIDLGFEGGSLANWTAEGDAFDGQPVVGDSVAKRRTDMASGHRGEFWVGTFEVKGDDARGRITSSPFKVTHPFASVLVAGGNWPTTRVEVVRVRDGRVLFKASGDQTETLKPVAVNLASQVGEEVFVRVVDEQVGPWGHINFDDFRFHAAKPPYPAGLGPADIDHYEHAGLSPEDAAKAMTAPPGFSVGLVAGEPDVRQPIALAIDHRGRLWVAEAFSYPIRLPDDQGRDRILIFEDVDGDGKFDNRTVFADTLNLVSGLEVGFGGVWVGAAPNLLFIPDADGDDKPDGPPRILLDGWGSEDTHETLNSFAWGPDGWLYGCHGVFTHSKVGKPGTPAAQRTPINAGIWRYHPTRHAFEVFAEGTSNPWGVDFDEKGQALETACVIPHLYHMIQGGRYERQAGQHFNAYTYDDIKTIADHRHYLGANPHAGNGRSDDAGGGHAHCGALVYQGDAWPAEYRGSLFMNNIHGARLNRDILTRQGSGFVGSHAPDFLRANDTWSQIISLKVGPDGQMNFIDWYDRQQCHHRDVAIHDRGNGRIFKLSYGENRKVEIDLRAMTREQLVDLQLHRNQWHVRNARRVLQERGPDPATASLLAAKVFRHADPTARLHGLWALHAVGGLDATRLEAALSDADPYVRAWAIQLGLEVQDETPARAAVLARLAPMAVSDPSPVVRLYLASVAQRLPSAARWDLVAALSAHAEDAADHNLPLMAWYAAEPLADVDPARALGLAVASKLPTLLPFMTRRIAAAGTPESLAILIETLGRVDGTSARSSLLAGLSEALKGRRQVPMPASWPATFARLSKDSDPALRSRATALGLTFGDTAASAFLRSVLVDASALPARRVEALDALVGARDPELPAALRRLIADKALRRNALRGLAAYDDPATPAAILSAYAALDLDARRDALNTLAARVSTARALLEAVAAGRVPSADVSPDLVRQLRNHKDAQVNAKIAETWGAVRDSDADRVKLIARYRSMLKAAPSTPADPVLGRAVFNKVCVQCHTLFGTGGKVGPELTGSNRADLEYLLSNVLDPSALIGKDYIAQVVATADGRVLTGIIRDEDKDSLTLLTANESVVLPKSEVEDRRPSDKSMMPDDLWSALPEHEVRALVAYLASPAQVAAPPEQASQP
ncbi:c-type cytochrome [Isosphaeraceae bacterium EP7]